MPYELFDKITCDIILAFLVNISSNIVYDKWKVKIDNDKIDKDKAILLIENLYDDIFRENIDLINDPILVQRNIKDILILHGWDNDNAEIHSKIILDIIEEKLKMNRIPN